MKAGRRFDRFELLGELASGGMGSVFRARDTATGAEVALKLLHLDDPRQRARLRREAQGLARVDHPHIVRLLQAGEAEGRAFLVLELLEGETLQSRLDRSGPLGPTEAAILVRKLALALQHAHARGVLHRDLKPANVLLTPSGPVLIDFGLALLTELQAERLSTTGIVLGTPGYLAPEQARGEPRAVGPPTDVYGLGAVLYAALTGNPPFQAASLGDALLAVAEQAPTAPEGDAALSRICLRCLAKAPGDRYASAEHLSGALGSYLNERSQRPLTPALLWAGVLALAILAVGAAAVATSVPPPETATPPPVTPSPPKEPGLGSVVDGHRRAAGEAAARGDAKGAIAALTSAIETAPEVADLWNRRGTMRFLRTDYLGAVEDFTAAVHRGLRTAAVLNGRGLALVNLGRVKEGLADLNAAVELDPKLANAHNNRGLALSRLGNHHAAIRSFDRAVELEVGGSSTYLNRATSYEKVGRLDDAERDLKEAIRRVPTNGGAYVNYASFLRRRDRESDALEALNTATKHLPNHPAVWADRAYVLSQLGRNEEAERSAKRATGLAPRSPSVWRVYGTVLTRRGRDREALKAFERAVELAPKEPHGYEGRARVHWRLGSREEAVGDMAHAVRLAPTLDRGHRTHVRFLDTLDRKRERLAAVEAWIAALGISGERLEERADAFIDLGRNEEAAKVATEALTIAKDLKRRTRLFVHRGLARYRRKQYTQSLADFDEALRLAPNDAALHIHRGSALSELGRDALAVKAFSRAIELDPRRLTAWGNRAMHHAQQGRRAEAERDYAKAFELDEGRRRVNLHTARSRARAILKDYAGALADAQAVAARLPLEPWVHHRVGRLHELLKRPNEAIAAYERALALKPPKRFSALLKRRIAALRR